MKKITTIDIVLCIILTLVLCFSLNSCTVPDWLSVADAPDSFDISNEKIVDADIGNNTAFYLTSSGSLYSPGGEHDMGCYTLYADDSIGLVATDVKDFGKLHNGGYYVTKANELYIWNYNQLNDIGYTQSKKFQQVLSNVSWASICIHNSKDAFMTYIDMKNNLYICGKFNKEIIPSSSPKLLDSSVVCAQATTKNIIWFDESGNYNIYGDTKDFEYFDKNVLIENNIKKVNRFEISNDSLSNGNTGYILMLSDDKLWYYGNLKRIGLSAENKIDIVMLSEDIIDFSGDYRTIMGVNNQGEGKVWGYFLSNSNDEQQAPPYEKYNGKTMIHNVKGVTVGGQNAAVFITDDYKTVAFS